MNPEGNPEGSPRYDFGAMPYPTTLGHTEERFSIAKAISHELLTKPELRAALTKKPENDEAPAILVVLPTDSFDQINNYVRANYPEGVYLALAQDDQIGFIYVLPVSL